MCGTVQQDKIAAEKKSIGFDYQFLYFIYVLLGIEPDQKVGYEVKDDVHLEFEDGNSIYMQLKHSLGEEKNLTEKDIDLWKTLYNWGVIISEVSSIIIEQISFIKKIKFYMVTNKQNNSNPFFEKVEKIKSMEMTGAKFKTYIETLKNGIKGDSDHSKKLKKYMSQLLLMDEVVLVTFLSQLQVEFNFDDVPKKLEKRILTMFFAIQKCIKVQPIYVESLAT